MGIFKKLLISALLLILILFDYAALDDITTGNEINYYLEYSILVASAAIFLILIFKFYKNRTKNRD